MPSIDPQLLLQSVAQALETMAFIAVEPLEQPLPEGLTQITLAFQGPVSGTLAIRAPLTLGALIAANLFATDPAAPEALAQAADALRELTNVTAGLILRELCTPQQMPQLDIPLAGPAGAAAPGVCHAGLQAEGQPLTIGLTLNT